MTLVSQGDVASQPSFQARVQQAMVAAAIAIQFEASTTTDHTNRSNYAQKVLQQPNVFAPIFAIAAVSDGVTDNTATDAALATRISAIWSALAGVI